MRLAIGVVLLICSVAMGGDRGSTLDSSKWSAVDSTKWSAIETKPLWERPATVSRELTLQGETERALDRGSGRIEDSFTFELRRLEVEKGLARETASGGNSRGRFEQFQVELDRQRDLDRARMRAAASETRVKVMEVESERLAGERERWMKQLAKPRHAEGVVVERQTQKD